MTRDEFLYFLDNKQVEIKELFQKASREYSALDEAFENFNKLAEELKIDRKMVLWIYLTKHRDGVLKFLNGHKSQREPVTGRIQDMIVYLFLLWGMLKEEEDRDSAMQAVKGLAEAAEVERW
jgi:hypothetical protein